MSNIITIQNIAIYSQETVDGCLVLTPRIEERVLLKRKLEFTEIKTCKINSEIIKVVKWAELIRHLYVLLGNDFILRNTTLNVTEQVINERGYKFNQELGFSLQGINSKKALKEIIHIVKATGMTMELDIRWKKTDEVVHLSVPTQSHIVGQRTQQ